MKITATETQRFIRLIREAIREIGFTDGDITYEFSENKFGIIVFKINGKMIKCNLKSK